MKTVAPPEKVVVQFLGMVTHVTGGGVERAVLPRISNHRMRLSFKPANKTDAQTLLGITCGSTCNVTVDSQAFRITDLAGNPLIKPFDSTSDPDWNHVTKLKSVPDPDNLQLFDDLLPEIFKPAPKPNSNDVAGWFELAGGVGKVVLLQCRAKFDGDSTFRRFPRSVTVTYDVPGGAKLQVLPKGANGDPADWKDIGLADDDIIVDNDPKISSGTSHFGLYALLSTKRDQNGDPHFMPALRKENSQACISGVDGVPGCSNSSWP